eukprot:scaffold168503_cov44-Prasinocladus_malaysianus.AAC.1
MTHNIPTQSSAVSTQPSPTVNAWLERHTYTFTTHRGSIMQPSAMFPNPCARLNAVASVTCPDGPSSAFVSDLESTVMTFSRQDKLMIRGD